MLHRRQRRQFVTIIIYKFYRMECSGFENDIINMDVIPAKSVVAARFVGQSSARICCITLKKTISNMYE